MKPRAIAGRMAQQLDTLRAQSELRTLDTPA